MRKVAIGGRVHRVVPTATDRRVAVQVTARQVVGDGQARRAAAAEGRLDGVIGVIEVVVERVLLAIDLGLSGVGTGAGRDQQQGQRSRARQPTIMDKQRRVRTAMHVHRCTPKMDGPTKPTCIDMTQRSGRTTLAHPAQTTPVRHRPNVCALAARRRGHPCRPLTVASSDVRCHTTGDAHLATSVVACTRSRVEIRYRTQHTARRLRQAPTKPCAGQPVMAARTSQLRLRLLRIHGRADLGPPIAAYNFKARLGRAGTCCCCSGHPWRDCLAARSETAWHPR